MYKLPYLNPYAEELKGMMAGEQSRRQLPIDRYSTLSVLLGRVLCCSNQRKMFAR
jgi:hypothetical protein